MDRLKKRIVYNINNLIKKNGFNRVQFCRETGLSYGTLRRALGERDEGMSTQTIVKISIALGVDPHELTAPMTDEIYV